MNLSVSHYDVHCLDLEKAERFYSDILGFERLFATPPSDAPLDLVWLCNANGVIIELTHEKNDYDALAINQASQVHLAFRTEDLDRDVAFLKAHGVEFELEPMEIVLPFDKPLQEKHYTAFGFTDRRHARMRISFFRGPSGERFELLEDCHA